MRKIRVLVFLPAFVWIQGCGRESSPVPPDRIRFESTEVPPSEVDSLELAGMVATPVIVPEGGSASTATRVSLKSQTYGVSIYYTVDGTKPTHSSKLYKGTFSISTAARVTVNARAFSSTSYSSNTATMVFHQNGPVASTPAVSTNDCSKVVDQCPVPGGVTWQCKKRFVFGVNYAWHNFSGDFGGIAAWNQGGISTTAGAVDRELADMKNSGASVVRWWVMPDFRGSGVTFDSRGTPTGLGATFGRDLLKAMELAEKNNIYLMLTIFSFDSFRPTRSDKGLTIRSLKPIMLDPTKRQALLEKVIRPMAKIAQSSPYKKRLMTWELMNEPEWAMAGANKYGNPGFDCNGSSLECVSHGQMESFFADTIKVLRSESKALISVGGAALKWKTAWTRLDLDYYQFHLYDWVNQYYPYNKSPAAWNLTDKPIVMGEYPLKGVSGANANTLLSSWLGNGYGGALGWSVTDGAFNWAGNRAAMKSFSDRNSCRTHY